MSATTSLYRCSSRRLYPNVRRHPTSNSRNKRTEHNESGKVSFSSAPTQYRWHSTSALFNTSNTSTTTPILSSATAAAALPEANNGSTPWDVAIASAMAFAATASLMYMVPSSEPASSHSSNTTTRCDSGSGGGSGGGGDGGPYATMAFAASPFEQQRVSSEVSFEPQKQQQQQQENNEPVAVASPARSKVKECDRRYDQISVRAIKGGRVTMEDEYFVAEGGRFVAVFDGHGGGGVSQFLKRHLYDSVCRHLKEKHWEESDADHYPVKNTPPTLKNTIKPSVFSHVAALKAAFSQIDQEVLADEALKYQGSTAVAVLLHESEEGHRTLLSANVGDSRAILSRRGRAVDLTRDHKPNDEREKARILAMGETIEWDRLSKVHRVRNLSLSRAIGDRYAKPVVSGEVEIMHYPVVEDGDEFILLASDGLWDVMTSDDAVSFVHQRIESELAGENIAKDDIENYRLVLRRNMAKFVAREALRRGSCDNVCVIMVWLNDLEAAKY